MKKLVYIVALASLLYSCDEKTNKEVIGGAITESNDITKIKTKLKLLDDSVTLAWKELDAVDSLKVAEITRLVQELSYVRGTIAPNEYKLVTTKLSEVKAQKLTLAKMSDVSALANYDLISDTLLVKTLDLTRKIKKQRKVNPIVDELAADIQTQDDKILLRRISYDNSAKAYNNYFIQNKEALIQADSTINNMPLKAYFNPENPI
jgi:hypothetical protein